MAGGCSKLSRQILRITGCSRSRPLIPYSGFGNKTTCLQTREELGSPRRIGWRRRACSIPPTTWMRRRPRSAPRIGLGTRCISPQTCDEDGPRLMTHVATDIGPVPDREALPAIHAAASPARLAPGAASCRCGICCCRIAGCQPNGVWRRSGGPHRQGSSRASPRADGLCAPRLLFGLGPRTSELPARPDQQQLDAHSHTRSRRHQNQVRPHHLWSLSSAGAVHAVEATHLDRTTARSLRSARSRPSARTDRGICSALRSASRDRRHPRGGAFVAWAYAARALLESRARIFSTWQQRRPSTCVASMTG